MTVENAPVEDAQPRDLNEAAPVKAGRLLRRSREAAGLHIAALAVTLKVPVAKLEALEAGRIDELPGLVFTRALASSVCRVIKLDPTEVLELLPASGALTPKAVVPMRPVAEMPAAAATEQLRQASAVVRKGLGETHLGAPTKPAGQGVSRAALVGVALLLVGALAVAFGPQTWQAAQQQWPQLAGMGSPAKPPASAANSNAATTTSVIEQQAAPANPNVATVLSEATASKAAAAAAAPSVGTPGAEPTATGASATGASASSASPAAGSTPASLDTALVLFEPSGEVWVEVMNARGVFLLRKTLQPGENTPVESVQLPLQVTVGRADSATVKVRGQAIDILSRSRDNVARFEVK